MSPLPKAILAHSNGLRLGDFLPELAPTSRCSGDPVHRLRNEFRRRLHETRTPRNNNAADEGQSNCVKSFRAARRHSGHLRSRFNDGAEPTIEQSNGQQISADLRETAHRAIIRMARCPRAYRIGQNLRAPHSAVCQPTRGSRFSSVR